MKKRFLSFCSSLLVCAFLINMLPASIFAQEEETAANGGVVRENTDETTTAQSVSVVAEITENRTATSKEFLLSNGLHMSALYATPVHYETDEGWEEIDNTLVSGSGDTLTNTAGVWNVSFPQQLTKDKCVTIEKEGYRLSFALSGELKQASGLEVVSAERATVTVNGETETFSLSQMQQASAAVQSIEALEVAYPETVPEKNVSRLQYADIYPSTDIVYDLEGNQVKESVVLSSYRSDLRGYRYALNTGELVPLLQEDGSILFLDKTGRRPVMAMPAPYLLDEAGAYNEDVEVQLTGTGGSYTLTYLLPQQWLSAQERVWPVVLDPAIEADLDINNIRDRTVTENVTYSHTWGMNSCGWDTDTGIQRFYLMYRDLPKLETSDVIVNAQIRMSKNPGSATTTTVEVHKVNGTWDSETLTWANKPGYDSLIEDYAVVLNEGICSWTITDIVRGWYSSGNTGMLFKADTATETGLVPSYKQFLSSDFGTADYRPTLYIIYRNNNGLEGYWDYTTAGTDAAGTGYVNNYTGNLVWVHADMGFSGNRMPVAIRHIYNMNDLTHNDFAMGYGWRTNYHQRVYRWSQDEDYYIWEDEDGTKHYFLRNPETGVYEDEDGLEMDLRVENTTYGAYSITDKNDYISYFDSSGRLVRQQNNQATVSAVTVTYDGSSSRISTITDGVGRLYTFLYTGGKLTSIRYTGTGTSTEPFERIVSFSYDGWRLTGITKPEGITATFGYDSTYYLMQVTDWDGYRVAFDYNTISQSHQAYRIIGIREYDGTTPGGTLSLEYNHNQTKRTDYHGNVEILQFNDFGNVVSVQDNEGKAQFAQYARNNSDETGPGNQLTLNSKLQNTVTNLLRDSNFESAVPWTPRANTTVSRTEEASWLGKNSLKMIAGAAEHAVYSPMFTVAAGETVTFSAYVKSDKDYKLMLQHEVIDGIYENHYGEVVSGDGQWTRQEYSYTNNASYALNMWAFLIAEEAGTFYMDCVQVEIATTASRYNILENGDFTTPDTAAPAYYWVGYGLSSSDGVVQTTQKAAPNLSGKVLSVTGSPTGNKQIINYVPISGSAGESFVVSGWAWADNAVPEYDYPTEVQNDAIREENEKKAEGEEKTPELKSPRAFEISVTLHHYDGTSSTATAKFNPGCSSWQYTAAVVVAKQSFHSIAVRVAYHRNANTVWFDGLQLYREEFGASYTYDEDGNVVSTTDLQKQTTTYEYDDDNNVTAILQDNKAKMTYEYDDYHNVTRATSEEGLVYTFAYDSYGNTTSTSIVSDGVEINAESEYTQNGNYPVQVTDPLNRVTRYEYDPDTGVLKSQRNPEDTEDETTEYTYDALSRPTAVTKHTGTTGEASTVGYVYTGNELTRINTATTSYQFAYGNFGLRTSVGIEGFGNLATYNYNAETVNDRKNDLDSLVYGNDDRVEYTYDDKGRPLTETYKDSDTEVSEDTVRYAYNNSGFLASRTDSATATTTRYYYDLTDRLMKYDEQNENLWHSVGYTYDTKNNLTQLVETVNDAVYTTAYTYDDDNRITGMSDGTTSVFYTYDAFGRLEKKETKNGATLVKTENFVYQPREGSNVYTSSQIQSHIVTVGDTTTTYSYTYDQNGNILTVSDGTTTVTYTYDSQNQLLRETNSTTGLDQSWTYDASGNITKRTEGSEEVNYTYETTGWKDLLKSYDGTAIAYDDVGNPTTYGQWSMEWVHGRQLASMEKTDGETWDYTYNADGLRTKRTHTANGTTTAWEYVYNGSQLTQMKKGSDTLHFTYDAAGTPTTVTHNGTVYYYVTNLQGDVVKIIDSTGTTVATYTYDAWGNPTNTPTGTVATLNPLRYRGYVYDAETGLYYVSSRYYDPEIGRWINADGFVSTGQDITGYNMFAYCGNNPVNRKDPTGQFWITALIVTAVAVVCTVALSGCSAQPTSDVGAAKPYVDMPGSDDPTSPNCYAYAIGSPVNEQPGGASGRIPTKWNDVNDVGKSVEADLKAKGHTVRKISGPDAKVYDNEFKIALRVGTQPYAYNQYTGQLYYDYHFMRQTNTGQWAEKHGYGGASIHWDAGMTPDTIPWTLGGVPYYDSAIIYYAVGN